jgi:hypothetical protein
MSDAREPQEDHVGMHLRLSVPEGDVVNKRKQFHLFVENAGWIVTFSSPS